MKKALRLGLHGVSERQDEPHDLRRAREPEIQLRGQAFLARGVLREHRRPQQEDRPELHQEPGARGPDGGSPKPEEAQGARSRASKGDKGNWAIKKACLPLPVIGLIGQIEKPRLEDADFYFVRQTKPVSFKV